MWQEMRKHEKKLRGMIVDYKRRSERRKEYYERIKRDPAEFLQIWGRPAKIHLDPAIAAAAESTLTPWRDDETTLIDRFDVRSHLDIIDEYALKNQKHQQESESLSEVEQNEERLCNYERYRVLIHNESTGVSEEQCLRDIEHDERFGALRDEHHPASREAKKKKSSTKKAEIGFVYDEGSIISSSKKSTGNESDDDDDDDDDDDLDIEIDISQLTSENKASLNKVATHYGMTFGDFARMLILDREEMQAIRENKLEREQDLPVKGRRARRERRLAKERRIKEREYCPPNYLNREIPKLPPVQSKSKSRSTSPVDSTPMKEKIEFITAFGDDDASKNDLKRKRPFEKSLLDECRDAKKKAEPTVIPIRIRRLATPPPLPTPTIPVVPCRSVQRKSQVLLSTLQKLKEDLSPERRVLSDDEAPAIKIVRLEKKEEKTHRKNNDDDDDDDDEDEDDDLQQYLKRKEARQRNQNSVNTPSHHREKHDKNQSTTSKSSSTKTPQEKLKRRMQSLLKKQFQKDKDEQRERQEREEREREARESELRQTSAKFRHQRSRHRSSSRSKSRSRSSTPRRRRRSSSRSSSTSSSSSSTSSSSSSPSYHSSNNHDRKKSSPDKARSPTPEFLRQRFRRDRHRRSSSSSSSSSRSSRNTSKRKRTDYK